MNTRICVLIILYTSSLLCSDTAPSLAIPLTAFMSMSGLTYTGILCSKAHELATQGFNTTDGECSIDNNFRGTPGGLAQAYHNVYVYGLIASGANCLTYFGTKSAAYIGKKLRCIRNNTNTRSATCLDHCSRLLKSRGIDCLVPGATLSTFSGIGWKMGLNTSGWINDFQSCPITDDPNFSDSSTEENTDISKHITFAGGALLSIGTVLYMTGIAVGKIDTWCASGRTTRQTPSVRTRLIP